MDNRKLVFHVKLKRIWLMSIGVVWIRWNPRATAVVALEATQPLVLIYALEMIVSNLEQVISKQVLNRLITNSIHAIEVTIQVHPDAVSKQPTMK